MIEGTKMESVAEQTAHAPQKPGLISLEADKAKVSDARGRVIVVSKLSALAFYKLTKALGESANNPATADLAFMAASVRQIDAQPFALPSNERDIEFVIQALDFQGLAAVAEGLKSLAVKPEVEIETAKN